VDIAECLEELAQVAAAEGQAAQAARICGAAEALRQHLGVPAQPHHSAFVQALRQQADEATLAPAWAEGGRWSQAEAVVAARRASFCHLRSRQRDQILVDGGLFFVVHAAEVAPGHGVGQDMGIGFSTDGWLRREAMTAWIEPRPKGIAGGRPGGGEGGAGLRLQSRG
jgi:hypothetical protein